LLKGLGAPATELTLGLGQQVVRELPYLAALAVGQAEIERIEQRLLAPIS
jgi:hypothetical protein